jgi:hypothetical protein
MEYTKMASEQEPLNRLRTYVEQFNRKDNELYTNYIPNNDAYDWMAKHIPLIDIPDKELEAVYYFRWWTYRKHIKKTDRGFVISEFLPSVYWAGKYNSISAACGHHLKEGRWLRNEPAVDEYIRYWYQESDNLNSYAHWLEYMVYEICRQRNDFSLALENLESMIRYYIEREKTNYRPDLGLFWSLCDRDAMEFSISGNGFRLPMNSYMCANAEAISKIALLAGRTEIAEQFAEKHKALVASIEKYLWSEDDRFYMNIHCADREESVDITRADLRFKVRELWGYLPWYFGCAPSGREDVFDQLRNSAGFCAPWGLTTAEKRHPGYGCFYSREELNRWLLERQEKPTGPIEGQGHECLWNGPVWPFATSQALTALARSNRLEDGFFFTLLKQYASSHRLNPAEGDKSPFWIDENMHPDTGDWISRTCLKTWSPSGGWDPEKGGVERGKDYNHSTFCDLIIAGLFGIGFETGNLTVKPRLPRDWVYAELYHVPFAGKLYSVKCIKGRIEIEVENE